MSFKHIKPGDSVFVVYQKRRGQSEIKTCMAEVAKVGRKFGYLQVGYAEQKFCLDTGKSQHPEDCNARSNGYGFDVYQDEEHFRAVEAADSNRRRLPVRLVDNWGRILNRINDETIADIHAILDAKGLP